MESYWTAPLSWDDPVVIWDAEAQMADMFVHGGSWVVRSVLELAVREGFVLAAGHLPIDEMCVDGENELEREIASHLPMARTREAIVMLQQQREAWRQLNWSDPAGLAKVLEDRSLHWLLNPPKVAIIGVPNAGKSTLANAIYRQNRSIVADVPGTTRDYIEDFANVGGLAILLVDTPGLRASDDRIETMAIDLSIEQIQLADLKVVLLDPTQPMPPQTALLARYPGALLVAAKADLAEASRLAPIAVSAKTGQGIAELENEIRRRFGCEDIPHRRCCAWTHRQRDALREAMATTHD